MKSTAAGRVVAEYTCTSVWLVEAFAPEGNSRGWYVGDLEAVSDVYKAWQYANRTEAEEDAQRRNEAANPAPELLAKLGGLTTWVAVEHGFC